MYGLGGKYTTYTFLLLSIMSENWYCDDRENYTTITAPLPACSVKLKIVGLS